MSEGSKDNQSQNTQASGNNQALKEGTDYYFENGFMVLTEHFLRNRGYCCGNACRHCPFGHENVSTTTK